MKTPGEETGALKYREDHVDHHVTTNQKNDQSNGDVDRCGTRSTFSHVMHHYPHKGTKKGKLRRSLSRHKLFKAQAPSYAVFSARELDRRHQQHQKLTLPVLVSLLKHQQNHQQTRLIRGMLLSYLVVYVLLPRSKNVALHTHLGAERLLRREVEHVVVAQVVRRSNNLSHEKQRVGLG